MQSVFRKKGHVGSASNAARWRGSHKGSVVVDSWRCGDAVRGQSGVSFEGVPGGEGGRGGVSGGQRGGLSDVTEGNPRPRLRGRFFSCRFASCWVSNVSSLGLAEGLGVTRVNQGRPGTGGKKGKVRGRGGGEGGIQ